MRPSYRRPLHCVSRARALLIDPPWRDAAAVFSCAQEIAQALRFRNTDASNGSIVGFEQPLIKRNAARGLRLGFWGVEGTTGFSKKSASGVILREQPFVARKSHGVEPLPGPPGVEIPEQVHAHHAFGSSHLSARAFIRGVSLRFRKGPSQSPEHVRATPPFLIKIADEGAGFTQLARGI